MDKFNLVHSIFRWGTVISFTHIIAAGLLAGCSKEKNRLVMIQCASFSATMFFLWLIGLGITIGVDLLVEVVK